jgi:hypothetical protein
VKRLHLPFLLAATIVASVVGVSGVRADPLPKVQVCHGTASATNPFVLIEVSGNALDAQLAPTDSRQQSFVYNPAFPTCLDQYLAGLPL